jgi:hypothetical protein
MQFEKHKGARMHSQFFGVCVNDSDKCWWHNNKNYWMTIEQAIATKSTGYSNFVQVKTFRAFKRHLRKYGMKGIKYTLVSRFNGYDISAYGRN